MTATGAARSTCGRFWSGINAFVSVDKRSSMNLRIKLLTVLILLTVLGIGPMPVTSVIGIYVVLFRPAWFKRMVIELYDEPDA